MKTFRFFLIALAALSAAKASDRWFEIRLAGAPTGYVHESVDTNADGGATSTSEMLFAMNRLGSRVEMKTRSRTIENASGLLVALQSSMTSSNQTTTFEAKRTTGGIELQTTSGGKTYSSSVAVAGPIYGPKGVEQLTREKLRTTADKFSYQMFVPELGGLAHFTRTLRGRGQAGSLEIDEVRETGAGTTRLILDIDGATIQSESELPFGTMVVHVSDRDTALRATKGSELPAETYERTMAHSNIRLPDARSIDRIKLQLTHRRPELGWPTFDAPTQRVLARSRDTLILEVVKPALDGTRSTVDQREYLKPNPILQSDDPEVLRLAATIVSGETDKFKAARKLQDWASENLKLDLGIALAPASEVARNHRGTCIAFAVLLASLERAAGIPSRFAMGYVYVDGVWAGHAWTEILVNGRWLPLDAAIYAPGIADAARFQFGSYTLEDNMAAAITAGGQLYANVEVAVLEYSINGRTVRVPHDAQSYTISGDTYRNEWLGICVHKPEGTRFTKLDGVYPDSTVLAIEGADAKLEIALDPISKHVDGRPALVVSSPGKANLVTADGNSQWVFTAQGKDAETLLDHVVASWKWTSGK